MNFRILYFRIGLQRAPFGPSSWQRAAASFSPCFVEHLDLLKSDFENTFSKKEKDIYKSFQVDNYLKI
jgi:hypothetical protein